MSDIPSIKGKGSGCVLRLFGQGDNRWVIECRKPIPDHDGKGKLDEAKWMCDLTIVQENSTYVIKKIDPVEEINSKQSLRLQEIPHKSYKSIEDILSAFDDALNF